MWLEQDINIHGKTEIMMCLFLLYKVDHDLESYLHNHHLQLEK